MNLKQEKAYEADVSLLDGKGTPNHGGGKNGRYWHIYFKGQRAGKVYINWVNSKSETQGYPSITIEINKKYQGIGIGSVSFRRACELSNYDKVYAETRKSNIALLKVAAKAGFVSLKDQTSSQVKMVWTRSSS